MRILLYGATGTLGQRILAEALDRGHEVTAAGRDPSRIQEAPGVTLREGDVLDTDSVVELARGHDVLVSAVGPGHGGDPSFLVEAARSLLTAARFAGVRLVVVGGAPSRELAPGLQPVDTTDFADTWRGLTQAHHDALDLYRATPDSVDWTYVSPAAAIDLGERTGRYRLNGDQPGTGEQSQSRISAEDFAVALLDEVERAQHRRQHVTVAY